MWVYFLALMGAAAARGRYEFIDDADLPAFYSLRSAQLAQQAAALQGTPPAPAAGVPGTPLYSPYYPYQIYQPAEAQTAQPVAVPMQYNPYFHYAPQIYRPQAAAVVSTGAMQPRVLYSPYYYGHQATGQLAKNKKKAA